MAPWGTAAVTTELLLASIDLRFETFVIRVASPDPDDLVWLAAFLEAGFEPVESSSPDAYVALTVDPVVYDTLIADERRKPGEVLEGFAKDSNPLMLERWSSDSAVMLLRDPKVPAFYRLSAPLRVAEIIIPARTPRCRTRLMRVVRELVMDHIVATGGVLIHGAAVCSQRGVIAVSGPKHSGKTTLLMSLLEHTDVAYVSNDRCVLRLLDDGPMVRGLPTIVSIRKNGLGALKGPYQRLLAKYPDVATSDKPTVSLGPHEFAGLFESRRVASGPALAFLFPHVTANRHRLSQRRLAPADALACLREGLFRAAHPTVLGAAFASDETRGRSAWDIAAPAARWVSENVPCLRVELGGGEPPTADECRTLLAQIST